MEVVTAVEAGREAAHDEAEAQAATTGPGCWLVTL